MSLMFEPTIRPQSLWVTTWLIAAAGLILEGRMASAQPIVRFDFTKAQDVQGWQPTHDVARLLGTSEGLLIEVSGYDPYIHGPARDYPADQPLWLSIRLKTTRPGMVQVFFFTAHKRANEVDSVRFHVRADEWEEVRLPLPPLGPGYHLRLDPPPGRKGDKAVVASLTVEARPKLEEPTWPRPALPMLQNDTLSVQSGDIELSHNLGQWGGFTVRVAGQPMACGFTRPLIGYMQGDAQRWIDLAGSAQVETWEEQDAVVVQATVRGMRACAYLARNSRLGSTRWRTISHSL